MRFHSSEVQLEETTELSTGVYIWFTLCSRWPQLSRIRPPWTKRDGHKTTRVDGMGIRFPISSTRVVSRPPRFARGDLKRDSRGHRDHNVYNCGMGWVTSPEGNCLVTLELGCIWPKSWIEKFDSWTLWLENEVPSWIKSPGCNQNNLWRSTCVERYLWLRVWRSVVNFLAPKGSECKEIHLFTGYSPQPALIRTTY